MPHPVYPLMQTFHLQQKLWIFSEKKRAYKLDYTDRKFNLDNLYRKPRCHVVSNAFSMSKNTAALDMLLLIFKVTRFVSLTRWSVVL
jgi:hypothetical protein